MKIKTKLALSMGAVFVLFCAAIAAALVGMQSTKTRFERFLQEDLELLQAATGMYAEGLQTGQALRNIVLDPANKTAYKNLEQAAKGFEQNGEAARRAATDPADLKVVEDILALRQKQAPIQSRIAGAAANDQPAAIKSINDDETPAWRAVRGRLLDFIKVKKAAVEETKERMAAFSQQMLLTALGMVLAAVVIGAGVMYWLGRHLMRQLGGEPAYAVDVARAIAEGDLAHDVTVARGDSASMLAAMSAMRANLTSIVRRIRESSEGIATASGQIASGNQDLSQRTEEQAASLEETAASMEELTGTVKQNAENARQANQLAQSSSQVALKGGEVVGQVVDTMAGINAASRKIADIITVIDGIAFQTNILALNAAVEAARAGEQGRGFAVVASEVRSLAQRSAAAAKEIKALIDDSVGKVDAGTQLVAQAGRTMDEIVGSIRRVTDIMGEIAAASQEQTRGIEQVNQAITQMDQVTQQNAALVEEASAAAQSMREQAGALVQAVSEFKVDGGATARRPAPADAATHAPATAAPVAAPRPAARKLAAPARQAGQPAADRREPAMAAAGPGEWTEF